MGGTSTVIAVHIGEETEFGRISQRINQVGPEAEFEHGIRRFGYLLMEFTLVLVLIIFAINPALDVLLFSTSLAVGLTPQPRP